MKIYYDMDLKDFDYWGGAVNNVQSMSEEDLAILQEALEDCFPDGIEATMLNDIMWFEDEWIDEMLGREQCTEM